VFTKADLLKELNAGKMQIAESYNFNNGEEVYVDTLPHLPQIYKDLTVKYTDPFTLK
jgi:hypothetical protein